MVAFRRKGTIESPVLFDVDGVGHSDSGQCFFRNGA